MERFFSEGGTVWESEEAKRERRVRNLADLAAKRKLKNESGYRLAIGRALNEAGIRNDRGQWFREVAAELGRRGGKIASATNREERAIVKERFGGRQDRRKRQIKEAERMRREDEERAGDSWEESDIL